MKFALLLMLMAPVIGVAAPMQPFPLTLKDAWVEPAPRGGRAFLHMLVANTTSASVILRGVSSPLAERATAQLYSKDASGLMKITPLPRIVFAPYGRRVFVPGALEIELIGLKTEFEEGAEIPLTLSTEADLPHTLRVSVGQPVQPALPFSSPFLKQEGF